ncbi:MAG: hypothetical protein IT307_05350 [Chloroflexi bacterium]|nr:hypothetical protein [Chloroflexota bacterium]
MAGDDRTDFEDSREVVDAGQGRKRIALAPAGVRAILTISGVRAGSNGYPAT